MRAAFERSEWENQSHTIASFLFKPLAKYRYEAGQYAVVNLPHAEPDNRGTERTLTLTSTPNDTFLKFTMRILGERGSSFKRAMTALRPGDEATIYDAMGDLVLPLDRSVPLVFVAGGVGIASFVAMTQELVDKGDQRDLTLLYGVTRPEDIVLQSAFDDYAGLYPLTRQLYSSAPLGVYDFPDTVAYKRLEAADIVPHIKPDSLLYLSGPESMVAGLLDGLAMAGISRQHVVFDYFD